MKNYKNLVLLVLVLILIGFFSCKKDVEGENLAKIEGTWIAFEETISNCNNAEEDTIRNLKCTDKDCITFFFTIDSTGTQNLIKRYLVDGVIESAAGTFSVGETSLTFCTTEDEVQTCKDAELSVTKNSLRITEEFKDTGCKMVLRFTKEEEN